jgi:hypothetical protein
MRHIKIKAPKGAKVMFQGTQDLIPDNVESEVVLTSYYRSRVLSGALIDVLGVIAHPAYNQEPAQNDDPVFSGKAIDDMSKEELQEYANLHGVDLDGRKSIETLRAQVREIGIEAGE